MGKIVYKECFALEDLPLWILEREHDSNCRSMDGLLYALGGPKLYEEVTAIGFYLV